MKEEPKNRVAYVMGYVVGAIAGIGFVAAVTAYVVVPVVIYAVLAYPGYLKWLGL